MPPEFREQAARILTDRELDVLRLRAEGHGKWRIAAILGISGDRVKDLRRSAELKMQRDGRDT
jgi:DNA-binding CsgD family transcriptional regulator